MDFGFEGENFSVRIVYREVRSVRQRFEVVVRPQVALCIPVTENGEVVLIRQHRIAINDVILEFPAGRVSKGEDPEDAVRRELVEEAGFVVDRIEQIGTFFTAPHFSDEKVSVFVANGNIIAAPTPTPKEDFRQAIRLPPTEINKLIADGRMIDSKSISAYALAHARGAQFGTIL